MDEGSAVIATEPSHESAKVSCPETPECPEQVKCPDVKCPEPKPCPDLLSSTVLLSPDKDTLEAGHLSFLRKEHDAFLARKSIDDEFVRVFIQSIDNFLDTYRDVSGAEEALVIKADIYRRLKIPEAELVALSKLIYEYPKSPFREDAEIALRGLIMGKLKKDTKDTSDLIKGPDSSKPWPDRYAAMLSILVMLERKEFDPFVLSEIDEFMRRYPNHEKSCAILSSMSAVYMREKNYESAAYGLSRLAALYPESPLRAESLVKLAAIYDENLKEYGRAIAAYQRVYTEHPASEHALQAHLKAADLYEKRLRDYPSAVAVLDLVVKKYPSEKAALKALQEIGRIDKSQEKYPDAIDAYVRLADMFKGQPEVVGSLVEAASIARKNLKDYALQIRLQRRIVAEYPVTESAVEALFSIAETYEKDLKSLAEAVAAYQELAKQYPSHSLAETAEKKSVKLLSK